MICSQSINKIKGCLFGQAVGDALGLGTEFLNKQHVSKFYPSGLSRYEDIIQDMHRKKWIKGSWTDDTDMMLCILDAFDGREFDIRKVAQNFKDWADGAPKDIGSHTQKVLFMSDYVDSAFNCSRLWWEVSRRQSAANGAVMRTSVIGCKVDNVETQAEEIAKLTHYDPRCVGSSVIISEIIHNLVWNNRELSYDEIIELGNKYDDRIAEWIHIAFNGDISYLNLDDDYGMEYTLRTLGGGLWAYFHSKDFISGLLTVVNEGGDADTNGAVAGAVLGAKFGFAAIPEYYVQNLNNKRLFEEKVNGFVAKLNNKIANSESGI